MSHEMRTIAQHEVVDQRYLAGHVQGVPTATRTVKRNAVSTLSPIFLQGVGERWLTSG
jgi:hypothetical protein